MSFVTTGFAQNTDLTYGGERGVSSVGGILGYAVNSKTIAVGIDYRYNIQHRVRIAPSVLYAVKNENKSTWIVNADAHYLTRVSDIMTIYPTGGLGLSIWEFERKIINLQDKNSTVKISETKVSIGLNLGFGGEVRVSQDILVGAEFRYNLTSKRIYDQAMILMRAAYYF